MASIYNITECSPKAYQKMQKTQPFELTQPVHSANNRETYPVSRLNVGMCFTVPLDHVNNESAFRTNMFKRAKELKIKLAVIKHTDEFQCYEVARIA